MTLAELMAVDMAELELGVRAYNILARMGCRTIEDVRNVSVQNMNEYTRTTGIAWGLPAAMQLADAQTLIASWEEKCATQ